MNQTSAQEASFGEKCACIALIALIGTPILIIAPILLLFFIPMAITQLYLGTFGKKSSR